MRSLVKAMQRRMWRVYTRGAAKLHDLTYLFWETTLRCNLSCRHCGSSCSPKSALPGELSTDEIKAALTTVLDDFDPKRITLAVTGGEPLLRPDVFEVAALGARRGMRWGMVTNGLMLTDHAVDLAGKAGMGSIAISLDGLKEHHEYLRGKGTFEPTVAAVKRIQRAGFLDILETISCPTPTMLGTFEQTLTQMIELKVDQWRIIPLMPIGRVKQHPELLLSGAQWREVLDWIREKRKLRGLPLKITLDEEGYLGEPYEREVRKLPYYCMAGINAASILADGGVGGCPSINRVFTQGNVRERRFSEIWEQEFKLFRDRSWMGKGDCAGCQSFGDCQGNSFHLWDGPQACGPNVCHLKLLDA